ncbi:MAG: hypothetical protein FIB01_10540 [Gemmatimonadetes bacterium]|nr:hypothetical protein [Gemmatimonadota bacterium]
MADGRGEVGRALTRGEPREQWPAANAVPSCAGPPGGRFLSAPEAARNHEARRSHRRRRFAHPRIAGGGAVQVGHHQNAAQALEPGGEARVAAGAEDGSIEVAVTDNGVGIPEHDLRRVFEPLFSTRPEGTGLGLPIARRIAVAHRGSLELESEAGKGTTVTVRLPFAPSPQTAAGLSHSGAGL